MLIRKVTISALFTFFVFVVGAQSVYNNHISLWPAYYLRIGINEKWKVVNDVQVRNFASEPVVGLIAVRSGINYRINQQWNVTAGGAWFHQQQINNNKQKLISDELRLWEELRNEMQFNKWQLINQVRTEQRHFSNADGWAFRFRYRLEAHYSLDKKWKAIAGNELMWQSSRTSEDWDQNRIWIGAEYAFDKNNQMQLVLMNWWQANNKTNQAVVRINFIQNIN
jgi:Protein of unknown function (DUF2490)